MIRVHSFLFYLSRENRLQLEAAIQSLFFFIIYISFMIATLDDDQEELLEAFTSLSFTLFLFIFLYFLYRYSIHYLSFLSPSDSKRESLSLVSQFLTDLLDMLGLVLRFLLLMLRLNLYDFLDDITDSYYIFLADFDDDEYYSDLMIAASAIMSFNSDVHDDRALFLEEELDFSMDLLSLYFLL